MKYIAFVLVLKDKRLSLFTYYVIVKTKPIFKRVNFVRNKPSPIKGKNSVRCKSLRQLYLYITFRC